MVQGAHRAGLPAPRPGPAFEIVGPQGVERLVDALLAAIPDTRLDIEDVVAEDEKVLVRLLIRGTHRGEPLGIAPMGLAVEAAVLDLFQIRGGRLAEHRAMLDNLGMRRRPGATSI